MAVVDNIPLGTRYRANNIGKKSCLRQSILNDIFLYNDIQYYLWVLPIPLAGFSAFLWDGIFIGATASRAMLYAITAATILFFITYFSLNDLMANNALWLSLIIFLSARGIGQTILAKKAVFDRVS